MDSPCYMSGLSQLGAGMLCLPSLILDYQVNEGVLTGEDLRNHQCPYLELAAVIIL